MKGRGLTSPFFYGEDLGGVLNRGLLGKARTKQVKNKIIIWIEVESFQFSRTPSFWNPIFDPLFSTENFPDHLNLCVKRSKNSPWNIDRLSNPWSLPPPPRQKNDPEFMSRRFCSSTFRGKFPGNFPNLFLAFYIIGQVGGPPKSPKSRMEAPGSSGSAGPVVDGPRQTVAQPPSLVLGSKTAGKASTRSRNGHTALSRTHGSTIKKEMSHESQKKYPPWN